MHLDLDEIGEDLVSLTVVTDPFGEYDQDYLRRCFGSLVLPFKEHFVTELRPDVAPTISKHHRYYARKALEKVEVEVCATPASLVDEWSTLYSGLAERHGLRGIKAFSRDAFARQLNIPGLVMMRATSGGAPVGMHLWYVQGKVAYSHLAASSPRGYELMASYALYRTAIEHFDGKVRWLDLGAGAGVGAGTDGLTRFKRGWSTGTATAYLCGRVFDPARYSQISQEKGIANTGYFPAYREGELA